MKTIKIVVAVMTIFNLLSFSAKQVSSAEVFGESKYERKEWYKSDNLGYWFDDLQWVGFAFDDWSSGYHPNESGMTYNYEKVLLLLRHSKGQFQPYLSIAPGLLVSENGVELDLGAPTIFLGLSCNF